MLSIIKNLKFIFISILISALFMGWTADFAYSAAGPGGTPPVQDSDDESGFLVPADIEPDGPRAVKVKARNGNPVGFLKQAKTAMKNIGGRIPASPAIQNTASSGKPPVSPTLKGESPNKSASPVTLSSSSVVTSHLKEGALKGYSIRYGDKTYAFRERPLASIDGKIYISASDPDFKALFDAMGLTYSWFSYSGKLFIFLPYGSVTWNVKEKTALLGEMPVTVPLTARSAYGDDYLPIDSIAALLDLKVTAGQTSMEIRPGVRFEGVACQEEKTIDIRLQSATAINYQVKYQASPPAIRLTLPKTAYNGKTGKFFVEGVQVRINDTVDQENLFITLEFPRHWKGRISEGNHKNMMSVRMMPNLVYTWGIKDQMLESIETEKTKDQLYLLFKTTGNVQYHWSFDPDEGVLYVDIPFSSPRKGISLNGNTNQLVKSCTISTLKPDNVNITRLRIELAKGANFMIGPPEDQKPNTFALLVGPREVISSPSPLMGSSSGMMAIEGGGGNLIVIDPGHGGSDPGACSRELGIREKDLTLDISRKMANTLNRMGYKVILTRNSDTDVTYPGSPDADELRARCDVANTNNAELFVSIHCNASVKKEIRGSSYHWYKPGDREVANALDGSLGPNIGTVEKGPRRDDFFVLKHTKVPSVLVECAFMSNPADIRILADENYRAKIALQLARSLDVWLRNKNLARTNRSGAVNE